MLKTAMVFTDNMVLQRREKVPVWGTAENIDSVTVAISDVSVTVPVKDGKWFAELPPMEACSSCEMTVRGGGEELKFKNVAIGEVWLAGGQSNMEFMLKYDELRDTEIPSANEPNIRFFDYPEITYREQLEEQNFSEYGFWRPLDSKNAPYFSAVGYYFAKSLYPSLNVPIGILGCNYGGSKASAWLDPSYLTGDLESYITDYEAAYKALNMTDEEYLEAFSKLGRHAPPREFGDRMMEGSASMRQLMRRFRPQNAEGNPPPMPDMRLRMTGPRSMNCPGVLYRMMLKDVIPYAIRGVLFYQGESDEDKADIYDQLFSAMIRCWRRDWGKELPFLFVQLAAFEKWGMNSGNNYPALRRSQLNVTRQVKDAYCVCAMDAGMRWDIHPKRKRPIGERLALLARAKVYGEDILCMSPIAEECTRHEGYIEIRFSNAGDGLVIHGDVVNALEMFIEGEPFDCTATAEGDILRIKCRAIRDDAGEIEIRYAEVPYCDANLYNSAGLPAFPFTMKV